MMLTLDRFLELAPIHETASNQYVKCSGFSSLYVRYGSRYIEGLLVDNVLDIANIKARKFGKGSFTDLFIYLRTRYPDLVIYVECIQNLRFVKKLERMGFAYDRHPWHDLDNDFLSPPSMFFLPE